MNKTTPPVQDLSDRYTDGAYLADNPTWGVEDSAWKAKKIYALLEKNRLNPSSICEVGCGAGEILSQLSLKLPQSKCAGYEVSPQAFELCQTRRSEKLEFHLADLTAETVHFDLLLCIDVFEHVEDYIGFIKNIKDKATFKLFHIPLDMSVLAILSGSMLKAREQLGHLHYYSKDTALATLADAGYKIVDWQYATAFSDIPAKSVRAGIAKWPRKLLDAVSPDLNAKLLGGSSLLVLAQ
jgi:hypothetical protein